MRKFTVKHGNGEETIEADTHETKDNRIVFKSGDHVVADFNASYVHTVREVKSENKESGEKKEPAQTAGEKTPDGTAQA